MITRITIQLIISGLLLWYKFYKIDNNISDNNQEPAWVIYWVVFWMCCPILFMWVSLLMALEKKDKSDL